MEFAPPLDHLRVPVAFVGVDAVDSRVLDLLDVGVGTQSIDVGVPAGNDSDTKGGEALRVSDGPRRREACLEVCRSGDPFGLDGSSDTRQLGEIEGSPLSVDLRVVFTSDPGGQFSLSSCLERAR